MQVIGSSEIYQALKALILSSSDILIIIIRPDDRLHSKPAQTDGTLE